jgi:hypothetical protein
LTSSWGSPDPRQRPFGPGHAARYPASYPARLAEEPATCPGFLLPFGRRHSLLGSSCSRPGAGPSSRSAYRARCARTRTGFPRSAPARYDRGGCPLYPGDGGALPARCRARPSPAASQRPVPAPRTCIPPAGLRFTRHQRGFTRFTRPACPSPVATRMGRAALGLFPVLRTAPLPATHDRAGPGVSTRPELRDRHNRPSVREFTRIVRPRVATADPDARPVATLRMDMRRGGDVRRQYRTASCICDSPARELRSLSQFSR